jgi:small neutral amino acid transporter SnatA (MarC family)
MSNQAQIDNMMRSFSQIDKVQPKVESTPKPQQKIMKKDSQTIVLILFALAFYTNAVWSVFSNDFSALVVSGTMCLLFAGIATYSALKN